MDLRAVVMIAIQLSIVLTVFTVALDARPEQTIFLLRRPRKLVRSLLAMNVVMPLFVLALAAVFPLPPIVKVALVAIAVSPVPPFLPGRVLKMGGSPGYTIGLLAVAALFSIVIVPAIIGLLGLLYGIDTHVDLRKLVLGVMISILAPLAVGIAVRQYLPRLADRIAHPLSLIATIMLAGGGLLGLIGVWPLIATLIGQGTVLAFLAFVAAGVVAGDLLGGPEPEDRTVLAFATASRHPGVAIGIIGANFPDQKLGAAAVFLYLLVSMLGTIPYTLWRKRHPAAPLHAPAE